MCRVVAAVTALKVLLIPAYRSTDFEVHRNWLAITYSLPLQEWYLEATSPWTLDYPPLFAWFEYFLAQIASLVDPQMLVVENLDYASTETVLFQRGSVIVSDALLIGAAWFAVAHSNLAPRERLCLFALVVGNSGLLVVDHIHFQYNGLLIGLLVWSVLAIERDQCLLAALLFAGLLNMKHLFLYSAPIYFAYLLKHYCLQSRDSRLFAFVKLASTVLFVCAISFGPFMAHGQIPQILSRLFPFGRGLCHAYWAPNAWALYSFVDKCLSVVARRLSINARFIPANMTGGLLGQWSFALLPDIPPILSLLLVLFFASLPALLLFKQPRRETFMECVAYANLCGFVWGYHVHEKAILPVLIPLIFVAFRKGPLIYSEHRNHFLFFSTAAHYSLTPLLHQPQEYPIKILLVLVYALYISSETKATKSAQSAKSLLHRVEATGKVVLLTSLAALELTQTFCSLTGWSGPYEFLPLMMTSVLCSCGICWYWLRWTLHLLMTLFQSKAKLS